MIIFAYMFEVDEPKHHFWKKHALVKNKFSNISLRKTLVLLLIQCSFINSSWKYM